MQGYARGGFNVSYEKRVNPQDLRRDRVKRAQDQ